MSIRQKLDVPAPLTGSCVLGGRAGAGRGVTVPLNQVAGRDDESSPKTAPESSMPPASRRPDTTVTPAAWDQVTSSIGPAPRMPSTTPAAFTSISGLTVV